MGFTSLNHPTITTITPPALHANLQALTSRRWVARMKVREAIRLIEDDGWFLVATRGSHRQYKHQTKPGRVTVAGKASIWHPAR